MFLTNFADEAVMLPLAVAVGCTLAALGWRRGAVAWSVAIFGTFAVMTVLKMVSIACGPPLFRSPSGHTAAAAVVCGGMAVLLGRGRRQVSVLLAAAGAAVMIGLSRLLLHLHTEPEILVGAVIGIAGALCLRRMAGSPPRAVRMRWVGAVALVVILLFHGLHLNAEPRIHRMAFGVAWALQVCRGEPRHSYATHIPQPERGATALGRGGASAAFSALKPMPG
jgi:hypothetical protein